MTQGNPEAISNATLIIEDNDQWASLLEKILQPGYGFLNVTRSKKLQQGLEALNSRAFTLIMLDLNLPDSMGMNTLRKVRIAAPESAILVMTGEMDQNVALQSLREGAQEYLVKGRLSPEEIRQAARHSIQRMIALRQLSEAEQLLGGILDALPTCIALLDKGGYVKFVNKTWQDFAASGNPLIHGVCKGDHYQDICMMAVDECPGAEQLIRNLTDLQQGSLVRFNLDYETAGGGWFEVTGTHLRIHDGQNIVLSHSDVTERKELYAQLKESEELFQAITLNLDDLLLIIDANGNRIHASASYERILGYSMDELSKIRAMELLHPNEVNFVAGMIKQAFETKEPIVMEYMLRAIDGSYRNFESKGRLITNSKGESQVLIVARDVTDRKRAEQEKAILEVELRHAQKLEAIGNLAAGIAHEINTPTQYIGDNLAFLLDAFLDISKYLTACNEIAHSQLPTNTLYNIADQIDLQYLLEEIPKALSQSQEGVQRVTHIVSAMKAFSHPDSKSPERADLNRAIDSTATVSRNEWKYVSDLKLDLDKSLPPVPCYLGEFNQVILNLIVNAAHAIEQAQREGSCPSPGTITIRTLKDGAFARIDITDTGTGIPVGIRDRIFEPFFTTKPVGKGTGQGLSIAHSVIVEKHHGTLSLDSEVGIGTTFTIRLPLEPPS